VFGVFRGEPIARASALAYNGSIFVPLVSLCKNGSWFFIRVIRGKFRMPDEMLTLSATFNRFENLFVSFVTLCKMYSGSAF
jgi:hypothetical protein